MEHYIIFLIAGVLVMIGFLIFAYWYFDWSKNITAADNNKTPNAVLGYNIAFDFLALSITGLIIVLAIILYILSDSYRDVAALIMGTSIGSILTRTPSFKDKNNQQ